jgi:hypothetical protein
MVGSSDKEVYVLVMPKTVVFITIYRAVLPGHVQIRLNNWHVLWHAHGILPGFAKQLGDASDTTLVDSKSNGHTLNGKLDSG